MPTSIDYKALHAELCRFLPKAVGWSAMHSKGADNTACPSLVRALPAMTDAGETILRVPHSITDENRAQVTSFLDIPLAFAFGESGLADLLSAENHEDQMLVIARAIAYLEIEHLGDESSES